MDLHVDYRIQLINVFQPHCNYLSTLAVRLQIFEFFPYIDAIGSIIFVSDIDSLVVEGFVVDVENNSHFIKIRAKLASFEGYFIVLVLGDNQ